MIFCVEDDKEILGLMLYALNAAGYEAEGFVGTRGTDGGKMLLLAHVESDVLLLRAFADYHSLVDGGLYADEHYAAVLAVVKSVGR